MKARQWMSDFLVSLASMINKGSAQTDPLNETLSQALERPSGTTRSAPLPALENVKPRAPAVPPELVAAYWKSGLDFIDFKSYSSTKSGNPKPLLVLPLAEVVGLGTQLDDLDGSTSNVDADVVLFLRAIDKFGKPGYQRHPLLSVPAELVDGKFFSPRTTSAPVLNPAYLAPDQGANCFAIADSELANDALYAAMGSLASDTTLNAGWDTWWSTCIQVIQKLVGVEGDEELAAALAKLASTQTSKTKAKVNPPAGWILEVAAFASDGSGSQGMRGVYTSYLEASSTDDVPLFARFCGTEHAQQDGLMPKDIAKLIVGHIDEFDDAKGNRPLFPLDDSQRKAVCAIASLEEGELQAINGPPGSGKTSMLRAVVASRWVSAALERGECPIILACGATNQSVTNVIEAFGKAPHPDARLPYAQRWIADVPSYGAYIPSQSVLSDTRKQAELAKFICLVPDNTSGMLWQYRDRPKVLDSGKALDYEEHYLGLARTVLADSSLLSVEAAVTAVWKKLASTVHASEAFVDAVHRGDQAWMGIIRNAIPGDVSVWPKTRHQLVEGMIARLQESHTDSEAAQGLADLTFRSSAFHWAARYWEGRFLLAQRERLFSRHPMNVEQSLRRLCMLTPCLVSTLHSVPSLCKVQPPADGDENLMHRLSLIDLLVIDEAGQASPELAGAALLLARRAAVVGDLKQLAPIWNHNTLSEVAVAGSVGAFSLISAIKQSRRSIADGSVLAAARLMSKWREENDLGITLRYHYRCKPSIIGYCNALSYNGHLVTRTSEGHPEPEPAMAWVSIESEPTRRGGSLCNIQEVEHITTWISERWPVWQAAEETRNKHLQDIVALITAYRAQSDLLRQELEAVFDRLRGTGGIAWPSPEDVEKVTVGTVHRLQGAERPIVCFSLVEGPGDASGSFMDRDPALLNVAVSRAKSSFIVFGHPDRLFPAVNADASNGNLAPIHFLGAYLRKTQEARLLYPVRLVVIEAGGKQATLSSMLGKGSAVVSTNGALQSLPLQGGVDIDAGLVPLPLAKKNTLAFVAEAGKLLESVGDIVIATDDDRMGELIAWQVLRLLEKRLSNKVLARVRLGGINGPAVREAFDAPDVLNERSILAESVRETIDCLISQRFSRPDVIHAQVDMRELESFADCGACTASSEDATVHAVGRVQAAVLRLLLDRARQTVELESSSRIRASLNVAGQEWVGYVLSLGEQRELTRTKDVDNIIGKVQSYDIELQRAPEIIKECIAVPTAGTMSVLAEAWRRFGHLPWQSMHALQSLYDGTWSLSSDSANGFEPEQPIVFASDHAGHPPIMPLDRSASPAVLAGSLKNLVCRNIYTIIWERFLFAESVGEAGLTLTQIRIDYSFSGLEKSALGVRFEGVSCPSTTPEQLLCVLGGSQTNNDAEHMKGFFAEASGLRPKLQGESAGRWRMPLDQLLLDMERAKIGRPSTCASSLERLVEKKLLETPIHRGQVRLTASGLKTALALEAVEGELSAPNFCTSLAARLKDIEIGNAGPRNVLGDLLPLLVPDHPNRPALRNRIWNNLEDLSAAQRLRIAGVHAGGLISASDEKDPT